MIAARLVIPNPSAADFYHVFKASVTGDLKLEVVVIATVILVAAAGYSLPGSVVERCSALYSRFASRRFLPILAAMFVAAAFRLSLLTWFPIPLPAIHDEFSYLLGAKTFALGRFTNPPHPLWIHFETFQVQQHPTYMSIYPPAQAAMLALGILAGNPWFAVLGCCMLVCGAFVWMLRPWFSPGWAFCGGFLLFARTTLSYWSDTYWGGALAALAGAIIAGAAGRIWFNSTVRYRDGLFLGIGLALLLNRRPFEGTLLASGIGLMLLYWLLRRAKQPALPQLVRLALPVLAILLPCGLLACYFNMRVTGNPFVLPYMKGIQEYAIARHDIFLPAAPEPVYHNARFREFYEFEYSQYLFRRQHFLVSLFGPAFKIWHLYLGPSLTLPLLLALPWIWRRERIRPVLLILGLCVAVNLTETWIYPHYVAPEIPLLWIVVIESMVLLIAAWPRWGPSIVAASILSCAVGVPSAYAYSILIHAHHDPSRVNSRVAARLNALPGKHLVIVTYLPGHQFSNEWVFNDPDIDASKIVWARDLGPEQNAICIDYFRGRKIWQAEVAEEGRESLREITSSADLKQSSEPQ